MTEYPKKISKFLLLIVQAQKKELPSQISSNQVCLLKSKAQTRLTFLIICGTYLHNYFIGTENTFIKLLKL